MQVWQIEKLSFDLLVKLGQSLAKLLLQGCDFFNFLILGILFCFGSIDEPGQFRLTSVDLFLKFVPLCLTLCHVSLCSRNLLLERLQLDSVKVLKLFILLLL